MYSAEYVFGCSHAALVGETTFIIAPDTVAPWNMESSMTLSGQGCMTWRIADSETCRIQMYETRQVDGNFHAFGVETRWVKTSCEISGCLFDRLNCWKMRVLDLLRLKMFFWGTCNWNLAEIVLSFCKESAISSTVRSTWSYYSVVSKESYFIFLI